MKKRLILTVASIMTATLMLSACSGKSAKPADNANSGANTEVSTEAGTESSEDNTLHVQVGPSPETIDPALNSTSDGGNMIIHAFEGLLKFDEKNNIVPGLAAEYSVSEDGLTWTFKLREGLKWSNGEALTAKDFVYSWKRLADPALAAPYAHDLLANVENYLAIENGEKDADTLGVTAVDDTTLEVKLSSPCTFFDKIVSFAVMSPVNEETITKNGDSWSIKPEAYITSGPYFMTEYTDGAQIVFEKNPNYYDVDKIGFDKIVWHLIEDGNTAYTAYQQGEIKAVKSLPTEEIPAFIAEGREDFHIDPLMGTYYISFNTQKAPFDNPKVREALSLAIDRKYVAETIMQGTYLEAHNFVGPGVSDAEEGTEFEAVTKELYGDRFDSENYESNVEEAKALLAEAGYPDGQGFPTVSYTTNDQLYHKPLAEYLQSVWKEKLGINVNINIEEWKTFSANRRQGNFEIARNGWLYDWDDPSNMINLLDSKSNNNDGNYSNPKFDKLLEEARTTADKALHYKKLHEAEQMLLDDAAMAPVAYYAEAYLLDPSVKGVWHSPYGYFYLMYGHYEK